MCGLTSWVRFLAAVCLCWVVCGVASATASYGRTLLVLGDSLSAAYGMAPEKGWVALLQRRLDAGEYGIEVVNASISGDITANGLARLPSLLEQHRPEIVIIELGGNDGLRGLSLQQMQHNIVAMIEKARAGDAQVLLVGVELPPNYGVFFINRFRGVYRDIAAKTRVPLVPFILEGVATDGNLMQADGIHPTADAQARMLENVWQGLQPMLERLAARGG